MKQVGLFIIALYTHVCLFAQHDQSIRHYNLDGKLAIQGYDPVAYFTLSKAVKGDKQIAAQHKGVTYYFSTTAHKTLFLKTPDAYEPQYGGWCAYAMGHNGEKVSVDPETYKILNGKLYLFYRTVINNTLLKWNKEEAKLLLLANNNWQKILK